MLVAGVDICVYCGTATQSTTLQPSRNRFTRVVTQGKYGPSEKTDFDFTDHAASELASAIGGMVLGRQPPQPPYQTRPNHVQAQSLPIALVETFAEQEPGAAEPTHEAPPPVPVNDDPQGAARFFMQDGDFLLQTTKDYKGANHADQQRRFILLYADAYLRLVGKLAPNTEHIKLAAEKAKIIDKANFSKYLTQITSKFFLETSTGVAINDDGKKEVERIIAEMDNPQAPAGDAYWNKSPANTTQRYRLSEKEKEEIHKWAMEETDLGQLDILGIKTGCDYALLAYWLLITKLKKGPCFRWNAAYEYLKAKFKAVAATPEKFSDAVRSPHNAEYFSKTEDAYYLSSEANAKVQGWVDGTSEPGSGDPKAK